jgi:hypothetical protein
MLFILHVILFILSFSDGKHYILWYLVINVLKKQIIGGEHTLIFC